MELAVYGLVSTEGKGENADRKRSDDEGMLTFEKPLCSCFYARESRPSAAWRNFVKNGLVSFSNYATQPSSDCERSSSIKSPSSMLQIIIAFESRSTDSELKSNSSSSRYLRNFSSSPVVLRKIHVISCRS